MSVVGIGKVFLVGAGPGDPALLTLRAAGLIACADVIAIDALVSAEVAALIPPETPVIRVGKRAGGHSTPQEEINATRRGRRISIARARTFPTEILLPSARGEGAEGG